MVAAVTGPAVADQAGGLGRSRPSRLLTQACYSPTRSTPGDGYGYAQPQLKTRTENTTATENRQKTEGRVGGSRKASWRQLAQTQLNSKTTNRHSRPRKHGIKINHLFWREMSVEKRSNLM